MRASYLDYNATAPLRPEARHAVIAALAQPGNASSVHGFGRAARQAVEAARESVAALAGARPEQVVFTGGGTEANNMALRAARRGVVASAGEHDSVLGACASGSAIGACAPVIAPVDSSGVVDLEQLARLLDGEAPPDVVAVMLANNETGVIQPVAEAARIAHGRGAVLHCDAVQAAGKIPLDLTALGADSMSLSAHKLGGPQGTGALILRAGHEIEPLLRGGGQERNRRAGTENVAAIAGFGAAARAASRDLDTFMELAAQRDDLERQVLALAPEARVHGAAAPRLPNTSCFGVPGLAAETLVMALDLSGVAVGAGSACSSGKAASSHVLRAMGIGEARVAEAIRISLGWASGEEDIAYFMAAWQTCLNRNPSVKRAAV